MGLPRYSYLFLLLFSFLLNPVISQVIDTIENRDRINVELTNSTPTVDEVSIDSNVAANLTTNLPIILINTNGVEIPDEPKIYGTMGIIDNGLGNMNNQYDPPNDFNGTSELKLGGRVLKCSQRNPMVLKQGMPWR